MNREELAEKLARELNPGTWWDHAPSDSPTREMWMRKGRVLADQLWPVLAQVWEDGHADFEYMPNPYSDTASSAT